MSLEQQCEDLKKQLQVAKEALSVANDANDVLKEDLASLYDTKAINLI